VIQQIVKQDKSSHRKQRHTARKIFERLREEHGYSGGQTLVAMAVRDLKQKSREVFLPLSHPPGEAQVDFGFADVHLNGVLTKVALFVMTLPYSDAIFLQAFPRECTESFLEGHVRAFGFFRGVLTRISYDNSKVAVSKVMSHRERKLTTEFLRLKSHFLYEEHFCLVSCRTLFIEDAQQVRKQPFERPRSEQSTIGAPMRKDTSNDCWITPARRSWCRCLRCGRWRS